MRLLFCGDVMPGGVLPYQQDFLSPQIKDYLSSFDLVVCTLETAIGTDIPYDQVKISGRQNIIYSRNEDFHRLKEMNVGIVSLANNHVFDLGLDGFKNTINILKDNGIRFCGAGTNINEASKPIILDICNHRIAILAYCSTDSEQVGYVPIATQETYGVNPFNCSQTCEDIKHYKRVYDKVVVMIHWGKEYSSFPVQQIKQDSYKLIESGADVIVGTHTHSLQPHIVHNRGHIFYSIGNFIFPDFYMKPPRPIYYPSEELKNIKITQEYPYPIMEPLKRVWKNKSRLGMGVELLIDKDIKIRDRFFLLDNNNILQLYKNQFLTLKLKIIGAFIKTPLYNGGKNMTKILSIIGRLKRKIVG